MFSLVQYFVRAMLSKPHRNVALFGLESAGKTSFFNQLRDLFHLQSVEVVPTTGQNVTETTFNGIQYCFWDLGGSERIRSSSWKHYFEDVDAFFYIVDGSDADKLQKSLQELISLTKEAALQGAAVVIVVTKQDVQKAVKPLDLVETYQLSAKLKGVTWTIVGAASLGKVNEEEAATSTPSASVYGASEALERLHEFCRNDLRVVDRAKERKQRMSQ